jgi:hypothetical protein
MGRAGRRGSCATPRFISPIADLIVVLFPGHARG